MCAVLSKITRVFWGKAIVTSDTAISLLMSVLENLPLPFLAFTVNAKGCQEHMHRLLSDIYR